MKENKKARVILIGKSTAGKTTLCQAMNDEEIHYHKTQTVTFINDQFFDTPGEYLERGNMRGALTITATDADMILFVQDATENGTMFPPCFAGQYCKPCIGVVTKTDIATDEQIKYAIKYLEMAGATKIFLTSSYEKKGCKELLEWINKQ